MQIKYECFLNVCILEIIRIYLRVLAVFKIIVFNHEFRIFYLKTIFM